jgi:hypothetical protein
MKIEYHIISSTSRNGLIDRVNRSIEDGWLPQGAAFKDPDESWDDWCQTMVRETDE